MSSIMICLGRGGLLQFPPPVIDHGLIARDKVKKEMDIACTPFPKPSHLCLIKKVSKKVLMPIKKRG